MSTRAEGAKSTELEARCNERIAGVMNCYDRVVITGTLPTVCCADGTTRFLHASGIQIVEYPAFASELRDQVRAAASRVSVAVHISMSRG